jgi:Na+/proline symporter
MQVVIGYFIGYFAVAYILLPLYYRMNLTSIYGYLDHRFGHSAYKTGAGFFILSRTLGATARLYLVINVLQEFVLNQLGVPFVLTTLIILVMIVLYTYKGGVKTIVWTDTLQTLCMLVSLVICVLWIMNHLHLDFSSCLAQMQHEGYTRWFDWKFLDSNFFLKSLVGGAFITITMTGMDQEMMQKNISVNTLANSQKNMITFSSIILGVNLLFLFLGGLLYLYATQMGIQIMGDKTFPTIALQSMPPMIGVIFIIGLISALFPSADGALTALTSSFCVDILGMNSDGTKSPETKERQRKSIHLVFALVFLILILVFKWINEQSIISLILLVASYTYGPLLGLFAFGIFTKVHIRSNRILPICIVSPILTYVMSLLPVMWVTKSWLWTMPKIDAAYAAGFSPDIADQLLSGHFYHFGNELILINGLLTFAGLFFSKK